MHGHACVTMGDVLNPGSLTSLCNKQQEPRQEQHQVHDEVGMINLL